MARGVQRRGFSLIAAALLLVETIFCLGIKPATALASLPVFTISVSTTGGIPISPLLYGINYDWDQVPQDQFAAFQAATMTVAHVTLMRFPGGWNAEYYNWKHNTEAGRRKLPDAPGIGPETLLAAVPVVTFITPSEKAIAHPEKIPHFVQQTVALVAQYGGSVHYWEIGNEWWLQQGAKRSSDKRARNLQNYATLLAAVVPEMKAENPSIVIFATGDWMKPADFATLRQEAGPDAWRQIDGISVHPYCGTTDPEHLCASLSEKLTAIRAATGKQMIYASEWAVAKIMSTDDYGIRNANYTVGAIQDLAFAGVTLAAYWPPVKVLPALAFTSADYATPFATGIAFGWMATYYRGEALHTSGALPAVAARNGSSITVIIPSGAAGPHLVRVNLAGTHMHAVRASAVLYSTAPDDPQRGRRGLVAALPMTIEKDINGASFVQFVIDPGTPGRGSEFEIARLTLD